MLIVISTIIYHTCNNCKDWDNGIGENNVDAFQYIFILTVFLAIWLNVPFLIFLKGQKNIFYDNNYTWINVRNFLLKKSLLN